MFKLLIGATLLAYVAAQGVVCPEPLFDDTQTKFCAINVYGYKMVTQSVVSYWNCLHPQNKFTFYSASECPANPTRICGSNTCTAVGPTVCGELQNPHGGIANTRTVFANDCEYNYYICSNPLKTYKNLGHMDSCMSLYYLTQIDFE